MLKIEQGVPTFFNKTMYMVCSMNKDKRKVLYIVTLISIRTRFKAK